MIMSRVKFLVFSLFLLSISGYAQDVITLRDGEQIKAKVLEISETETKYKRFDNLDGPTRSVSLASVFSIDYANGTREVINPINKTQTASNTSKRVFRFGLRTGINFTNMSGYDDISKMLFGFQSGIVTDFSLAKSFSIQAGLLIAQQGFRTTAVYKGQKSPYKITLYYIQLPINAQYKLALGSNTSLLFQTGPYFGYCFLGTASENGIDFPIKMGYKERDVFKTFDFGLGLGVGVQVYGLQIGIGYNIGLYNLHPSYFSDKSRNHGLAITVTYLFGK